MYNIWFRKYGGDTSFQNDLPSLIYLYIYGCKAYLLAEIWFKDIVKIGNHFENLIEHVQSLMHYSPPRLPLIAMAAAFPAFSAAYSVFSTRLLQHTRWLTAIQCLTISLTLKAPTA